MGSYEEEHAKVMQLQPLLLFVYAWEKLLKINLGSTAPKLQTTGTGNAVKYLGQLCVGRRHWKVNALQLMALLEYFFTHCKQSQRACLQRFGILKFCSAFFKGC